MGPVVPPWLWCTENKVYYSSLILAVVTQTHQEEKLNQLFEAWQRINSGWNKEDKITLLGKYEDQEHNYKDFYRPHHIIPNASLNNLELFSIFELITFKPGV